MNIAALPFDVQAMLAGMRRWVACESPSWDGAAVSRMTSLAARDLAEMGAEVRTIPGERGYGDCLFAEWAPSGTAPGILVLGHLDTVHPLGSYGQAMPWREAGGRCYGPGLFDMKSGNYLALEALRQLRAAGISPHLPVRFLLTSDEESGSPSTRALIELMAAREKYVLVPEGAQPNGNLVSGRFPSTRFQLWTHGKPAHALLQREQGRSAISAMARLILEIEAMNGGACSFTVTCLNAGRAIASVPLESYAEIISTARTQQALDDALAALRALGDEPEISLEVKVKTGRPLWQPSDRDAKLWQHAHALSRDIGFDLGCEMLFGGSDGNFTGAMGIPTLDGLGPVGADAHQLSENIEIASLVPRGRLIAGLMATLD